MTLLLKLTATHFLLVLEILFFETAEIFLHFSANLFRNLSSKLWAIFGYFKLTFRALKKTLFYLEIISIT